MENIENFNKIPMQYSTQYTSVSDPWYDIQPSVVKGMIA